MTQAISFSASNVRSSGHSWWSRWWNRGWNTTSATAVSGQNLFVDADVLNVSAVAIDTRRWGWGSQHATGLLNSNISFTGNRANISAFAQGNNPFAVGMDYSSLYMCGSGDKVVTLSAHSRLTGLYDPSWAMRNSGLYTGYGNDIISITTSAKTVGWGNGNVATIGLERSVISTGYGNDDVCLDNHASTRGWRSTARATGLQDSVIDLGSGRNVITADVKADQVSMGKLSDATVLDRSAIVSGNGNDYVGLSATADNYLDTSRSYSPGNSYERSYERSYSRSYGRDYGYRSFNSSNDYSYAWSTKSQWSRESETQNGHGRSATATTLDNQSSVLTGEGDDQVFLNAFAKGGNNTGRSYWWWSNYETNATVVDGSRVDVGMGNDTLGLNAQSNGNATGGWNAQITLGQDYACGCNPQDDDVLKISANASDLKFTSYKYSSTYENSSDYRYLSSYNSSYTNCDGSKYETSRDYSRESSYSYKRSSETESRSTLNGNTVNATGLENSVVRAGIGDDAISIDATAERTTSSSYRNPQATATGIKNTLIDAGAGNDSLTINAEASAEYERTYKYSYKQEHNRSYSSSSEYERSYESADGTTSSSSSSSRDYSRDYSRSYSREYGYSYKDTLTGDACAVDCSTISMGSGNDTVALTSNDIITRNSIIDMGAGNDVLTMGGTSLDAFQNSIFNGGAGYDRISLTGFSGDDLGTLKEQFSFDAKSQTVTLGSSTFSGFEQVQLGDDLFTVATDFAGQSDLCSCSPQAVLI